MPGDLAAMSMTGPIQGRFIGALLIGMVIDVVGTCMNHRRFSDQVRSAGPGQNSAEIV